MNHYDWEAIERDYRAGQLSIRHLAAKHGIPESTVRSRAKAEGWQRDLTDEVRAATQAKLTRTLRSGVTHGEDDAEIIEGASNEAADLVTAHRHAVARWRRIADRLAGTLETMPVHEECADRFARSLNSGIDALSKVIRLERQAYNLDEAGADNLKTFDELMAELALDSPAGEPKR
ncbi:MAG: helix-turn-helix domain-containing protein [Pseudomonadota bacterium]